MGFQEEIWGLLKEIPEGRVTTYKVIAEKLGTKAYRAVGNACNKNPFAPKAPCHRVVNSDGRIGGFASGTEKKIELLKKEGIDIQGNKIKDMDKILFRF